MWFRMATDVKIKRQEKKTFKYKVIPGGVMTMHFPVEETLLIVTLGTVDRGSITDHDLIDLISF